MNSRTVSGSRSYAQRGWWRAPFLQDAWLVVAAAFVLTLHPRGALAVALVVAIGAAIAWSRLTLHFPSRVEIDADGVSFGAYGREHRFAWRDVERVTVRRFVVRDRILVRIVPSPPWRGRYWLMDSIDGFHALAAELEARGQGAGAA